MNETLGHMKASAVIRNLASMIATHGDQEVYLNQPGIYAHVTKVVIEDLGTSIGPIFVLSSTDEILP